MARQEHQDYARYFLPETAPSLACVVERVRAAPGLRSRERADLISSVRRAGEIIGGGLGLDAIPADPARLRVRLADIAPAKIGMAAKTWANIRSALRRALAIGGVTRRQVTVALSGEWAELWARVLASENTGLKAGLTRFVRFCQRAGIRPSGVTSATIEAFEAALVSAEVTRDPRSTAASAVRAWNRAARRIEGWPQTVLKARDRSRQYSLGWDAFPPTLETDVDAWLADRAGDDIFSIDFPARPIGPATRKARKGAILRFASAAVRSGVDHASLQTLADLVRVDTVKRGLVWLYEERLSRRKTGALANVAIALRTAARWHVGVDQKHLDALGAIVRQVSPRQVGMTPKNQARMEPFKDEETVVRLLKLPETMVRSFPPGMSAENRARRFETALVIAILTYCPVRFGNLRSITIDRHIVRHGQGRGRRVLLHFPEGEVKNRQSATFELPPALVTMIDRFITVHRPALLGTPSRFLFSSRSEDAPIDADALSRRMPKALRHHLGLELSPHGFRHLSGLVYLSHHPGAFEMVRRLLGHTSSSTATDAYIGLEGDAAHRVYVSLLNTLRGNGNE